MTNPEPDPIHTIRLRRPWQKQFENEDSSNRIDVPEAEPATDTPVTPATYIRRFNRPSGLTERSQLRLKIGSWKGELVSLNVNDQELAAGLQYQSSSSPIDVDIAHLLANHNCITIVLAPKNESPDQEKRPVQLTGPVVLNIVEYPR